MTAARTASSKPTRSASAQDVTEFLTREARGTSADTSGSAIPLTN